MWKIGDSEFHEISKCGRFQIYHLISSGGAQLIDIGTDKLPRPLAIGFHPATADFGIKELTA